MYIITFLKILILMLIFPLFLLFFFQPAVVDGRYHREGGPGAWYGSSSERAAWAELIRHTPRKGVDRFEMKRRIGRIRVKGLVVLDLTSEATRLALGLGRHSFLSDDLVGEEYARCQDLAERARKAGFEGVLAPSAAMRGELTLVVFPEGIAKLTEEHSRVQSPPRTMKRYLRRIPRRPT